MKKQFPTFIHESAADFDTIIISGGRLGVQLILSPQDLIKVTGDSLRILSCTDSEWRFHLPAYNNRDILMTCHENVPVFYSSVIQDSMPLRRSKDIADKCIHSLFFCKTCQIKSVSHR